MKPYWMALFIGPLMACSNAGAVLQAGGSEETFAAGMIERIKRKAPAATVKRTDDPLSIRLTSGVWDDAVVNFHRVYQYCGRASKAECGTVQARFVDQALTKPPEVPAPSLRIAVRDRKYVGDVQSLPSGKGQPNMVLVTRALGDDLFALVVGDSAGALTLVTPDHLQTLHLTQAAAWKLAWNQTRAILPALPTAEQLRKHPVQFENQEYLASMLADLDGWKRLSAAVGPDLFMTVVADNYVFIGTIPDGPSLESFKKSVSEDCMEQQRCVSPHVYRFRGGRWVVAR